MCLKTSKLVFETHGLPFAKSPTALDFPDFPLPLLTGNFRFSPESTASPVALSHSEWFFFQIQIPLGLEMQE